MFKTLFKRPINPIGCKNKGKLCEKNGKLLEKTLNNCFKNILRHILKGILILLMSY